MSGAVCVLDASVALGWCFEDEASAASDALLQRILAEGATVPAHWHLEVARLLLAAGRRQRISAAGMSEFLALLDAVPLETDATPAERARHEVLHLARETGLSPFDASYLDLAARRRLPLASKDRELCRAADALGLTTLPL